MRHLGLAVLVLLGLLIPAGCSTSVRTSENAPIVRVRILENQEQVLVAASSAPIISSSGESGSHQLDFPRGGVPVTLSPAGWRIGGASLPSGELTIKPQQVGAVSVNGSAYRGRYRFVPNPSAPTRFDVINDVDIDSYLMSVVSKELLHDWLPETYKAQAIVARTYALYEARIRGSNKSYDLEDDDRSQVYGGIAAESSISRSSVMDTAGIVVAYGPQGSERIFKAYFSSCCGGIGQSAYDAFGDPDIPPLRAKNAGTLCNASPRFNWGPIVIPKTELTRRIRNWGTNTGQPEKDMDALARIDIAPGGAVTGRPVRFLITDTSGRQYSVSGEQLRWAVNGAKADQPKLNSSFVTPVTTPDTIQFVEGHGWGHGVGMCQWCAQAMAQRGQRAEYIVRVSYPGAVLVRAY
jgi:stage II sporulation protein D